MRSILFFVASSLFVMGIFAGNRNIYSKPHINSALNVKEEVLSESDTDNPKAGVLSEEPAPTLIPFPTLVTLTSPKPTTIPPTKPLDDADGDTQILPENN